MPRKASFDEKIDGIVDLEEEHFVVLCKALEITPGQVFSNGRLILSEKATLIMEKVVADVIYEKSKRFREEMKALFKLQKGNDVELFFDTMDEGTRLCSKLHVIIDGPGFLTEELVRKFQGCNIVHHYPIYDKAGRYFAIYPSI